MLLVKSAVSRLDWVQLAGKSGSRLRAKHELEYRFDKDAVELGLEKKRLATSSDRDAGRPARQGIKLRLRICGDRQRARVETD